MATYQIELNDEAIKEQISRILEIHLNEELIDRYSGTGKEISVAVKELIYSHKDEIIEQVVSRAAKEIARKALPKLLDVASKEDADA